MLLFSCTQENVKPETNSLANLSQEQNNWKSAAISSEIIENQKQISHYEFNLLAMQDLINTEEVSYIWFDLGINQQQQITISATAVNTEDVFLGEVASTIINTKEYQTNFSIFNSKENLDTQKSSKESHILSNRDAYNYLEKGAASFTNFEATLTYDTFRIERFGINALVIKQILQTKGVNTLALFLGINNLGKRTTVLMAKDSTGNLLINNTNARAFDFTNPCPPYCDPDGN